MILSCNNEISGICNIIVADFKLWDDIPDYQAMKLGGLACCPADAVSEIKSISNYISPINGGEGCVRDIIEKVLKLNGHWDLDTTVTSK